MMYFSFLNKLWTNLVFITLTVFIVLTVQWNTTHLTVKQDTQNFQIPSTHRLFLYYEFGDVPHKTRKTINFKYLSYSLCLSKAEYSISSHCFRKKKLCCFSQYPYAHMLSIHRDTWYTSLKKLTNEKFTHYIYTVWFCIPHNMCNID